MKKITYLFVTMLMALTMVGCQVDLSDYLTKEEAEKTYATKTELAEAVKDLQTKFEETLKNYATKKDLEGYATKESVEALGDISNAVSDYLAEVDFSEYLADGYTKAEVDAKIKAITDITDKLAETYETIENVADLSTKVESLETKVLTLTSGLTEAQIREIITSYGYVTTSGLTTEEIKSIIESYGYTTDTDTTCGLTTDQVAQIKTLLTQWTTKQIDGVVYDLTNYVTESDLASYVKSETLDAYAKKSDYVSTTTFNAKVSEIESRITTVEGLVTRVATLETKVTTLEADMLTKANTSALTSLETTVGNLRSEYNDTKATVNGIDLTKYLTITDADNTYATKTSVTTVSSNVADLTTKVEALKTLTEGYADLKDTVASLKLAVKGADGNGNLIADLTSSLASLQTTVTSNYNKLVNVIGDTYSNAKTLETRIAELETLTSGYASFVETTNTSLAKISEIESALNDKADKTDILTKTQLVELLKNDFIASAKETTFATKTSVDTLTTTVNAKADTSALETEKARIDSLVTKVTNLESDKTKVEYRIFTNGSSKILLIKITSTNNKSIYLRSTNSVGTNTIESIIAKTDNHYTFELTTIQSHIDAFNTEN